MMQAKFLVAVLEWWWITESLMVVEALLIEYLVAEMALASHGRTMLVPLVVDEAGMVEATTLLDAMRVKV